MHVLMYADRPAGLGGIETHLAGLGKELAALGVDVTVAFKRLDRTGAFEDAAARGVRVIELERTDLEAFALEEGVDMFHAHSFGASEWGVRTAKGLGLGLVVTLHGPDQRLPSSQGGIDCVIAVSRETARPLLHLGERVAVIENGIDLTRFNAGPRAAPSRARPTGEPLRAAYLGRVGPSKKPGLLALQRALGARSDMTLRYISNWAPPPGRAEPTDDPAEALKGLDIVFSTGRGIREAMACGAAACVLGVCWDGLVTPERLEALRYSNFSGRASRRRPTESDIAQTVYSLISDRRRLAELHAFGPTCSARLWDIKRQAERTHRIYQAIMAREAS